MSEEFELEPTLPAGEIPQRVIDELIEARAYAVNAGQAFGDAIKAQATKHDIKPAALKRYVCALQGDTLDETRAELDDLEALMGAAT